MLKAALGLAAMVLFLPVLLMVVLIHKNGDSAGSAELAGAPTDYAKKDIPPDYLNLYAAAARTCPGLPWAVLAAVGKVESDHGRGADPGIKSGANYAGAMGPMQFLGPTWATYHVDGDEDGVTDVYNPADAIPTAAKMLCADGAKDGTQQGIRRALFAYNHAYWYVGLVFRTAAAYSAAPTSTAVGAIGSVRGAIAVRAALRWLGTPYSWGGGGPSGPSYGTGRGAGTKGFDCSGLAQYAWAQAGIPIGRVAADQYNNGPHIPRDQLQPGDLLFFATDPSNPVTIHHVALYLGNGQMIHAPHTGVRVRISPFSGVPSREAEYAGATRPGANPNR